MELSVYWTQLAEEKLDDIFSYYKMKAGKNIAARMVNGIIDTTIGLGKRPRVGQKEELLADRVQEFRYLIYKH